MITVFKVDQEDIILFHEKIVSHKAINGFGQKSVLQSVEAKVIAGDALPRFRQALEKFEDIEISLYDRVFQGVVTTIENERIVHLSLDREVKLGKTLRQLEEALQTARELSKPVSGSPQDRGLVSFTKANAIAEGKAKSLGMSICFEQNNNSGIDL